MNKSKFGLASVGCCQLGTENIVWRREDRLDGLKQSGLCLRLADTDNCNQPPRTWYEPVVFCPFCGLAVSRSDSAAGLCRILEWYTLRFDTEAHLQEDVATVLKVCGIKCRREFQLPGGPIDFRTEQGIGIECKVDGSPAAVLRQLLRYAEEGENQIREVLLVTSKAGHRWRDNLTLCSKPFEILWIGANSL